MLEDGRQRFNAGQAEFKQALEFQKKENRESAAKLNSGAGEIRSSADKMSRDFQKAAKDLRDRGHRDLQNGLNQFKSSVDAQIKENQSAISRIGSGARELQEKATSFQNEIHRYQEQDLKNSVRDFYYG
jgi:gas vesicle protein